MFRYALGLSSMYCIALLGHKEGKTRQKIRAKAKKQANTFLPIFAPILFIAKTKEIFFLFHQIFIFHIAYIC